MTRTQSGNHILRKSLTVGNQRVVFTAKKLKALGGQPVGMKEVGISVAYGTYRFNPTPRRTSPRSLLNSSGRAYLQDVLKEVSSLIHFSAREPQPSSQEKKDEEQSGSNSAKNTADSSGFELRSIHSSRSQPQNVCARCGRKGPKKLMLHSRWTNSYYCPDNCGR